MSDTIVVELGLTKEQVQVLRWILICWLGKYEDSDSSVYKENASAIYEAIKEV